MPIACTQRPSPWMGAHKGWCFIGHETNPGTVLPLPEGEGTKNLPQKARLGRMRVGVGKNVGTNKPKGEVGPELVPQNRDAHPW
jgi:hypothetical protein